MTASGWLLLVSCTFLGGCIGWHARGRSNGIERLTEIDRELAVQRRLATWWFNEWCQELLARTRVEAELRRVKGEP